MFDEGAIGDKVQEGFLWDEVVVDSVDFAFAGGTGGVWARGFSKAPIYAP